LSDYKKELNIADILSAKRREKGVTQDEVAEFIGVSKASVSKWETGLSYPDITFLPVLASYFDISIDTLMGYSPKLNDAEVNRLYEKLSSEFANAPFEEVITECAALIKKYYSCELLLLKMAQLYINHANLAGSKERANELLMTAGELCERVRLMSQDASIIGRAEVFEALCRLLIGEPQKVFEVLGNSVKPRVSGSSLIAQAYRAIGDVDRAKEVIQTEMYQDLMGVFGELLSYIQVNADNFDVALSAFNRAEKLAEMWNLRRLNPNSMAQLYVFGARIFLLAGKPEEAVATLKKYVDVCVCGFFPPKPRGDAFFDKIDNWLNANTDSVPRSDVIIKESMLNDVLLDPVFESLRELPEYVKLVKNCAILSEVIMTEQIIQYMPFLIPLAVIQIGLMLAAVIHILRHNNFRVGNKAIWLVVSILVNTVGPVLYFVIGREENAGN